MRKISLVAFLLCVMHGLNGQDSLQANYDTLRLKEGNYLINQVVTINHQFVVEPGVSLLFNDGGQIVCLGGVKMLGTPLKRIQLKSVEKQSGTGMVIAGIQKESIEIAYVNYRSLVMPINFEFGWFRSKVSLHHNQFYENTGSNAILQILNPLPPLLEKDLEVQFVLENNLFAANLSPVYVEDFAGDNLKLSILNNAFVENKFYDFGKYTFSGNVLFGRVDQLQTKFLAKITGNSFVNNLLWDSQTDTILHQANMGIYGSADSLLVPKNYWGANHLKTIKSGIFDYSINYTSPKLSLSPFLTLPAKELPPHIYQTLQVPLVNTEKPGYKYRDGAWVTVGNQTGEDPFAPDFLLSQGIEGIKLLSNQDLDHKLLKVHFIYLKDSLVIADSLLKATVKNMEAGAMILVLSPSTDSLLHRHTGYLLIDGLKGQAAEWVPPVKIGFAQFLKYYNSQKIKYELVKKQKDSIGLIKPKLTIAETLTKFKKRYELGMISGYALYYGTLSNGNIFKNDLNGALGLQFRYHIKNNVSLNVSFMHFTLTGSDLRSGETAKMERGMSFKTPVNSIGLGVDYDFLNNRLYSSKYKLRPTLGFGFEYMSFHPMGEYLGNWYELQPMGTGGQTIAGSGKGPYALSSLGANIKAQARYFISKKSIFSIFTSYHFAFSNYLDDVGGDPYPDKLDMAAANPAHPDAAVYFSNPSNRLVSPGQLRSGQIDGADGFFMLGFSLSRHF